MNPELARIIERLRKMIALGTNAGATDAERETAMRMAHKLLAKHNLSMAQIEATGKESEEKRQRYQATFYGRPWARVCASSIAKLFFCKYIVAGSGMGNANTIGHWFIGKESNSITAAEMAKFVVESIRRESKRRQRENSAGNAYARSFATGAAAIIAARVDRMLKESAGEKSDVPGTSLVLASVYQQEQAANTEFIEKNIKTKQLARREKETGDLDAYQAGVVYGKKVPLSKQIGESK